MESAFSSKKPAPGSGELPKARIWFKEMVEIL
jgi:hypothetical protein